MSKRGENFKMEHKYVLTSDGELYHYGVKGMKWGVRRYQNEDGSLTEAGKKRLSNYQTKELARIDKKYDTSREVRRFNKASERQQIAKQQRASRELWMKNAYKAIEKSKVMSMTYEDMQKEKLDVGMRYAKSALVTIGSHAAMFAGVTPIALVSVPIHNDRYKTRRRLEAEDHREAARIANNMYDSVWNRRYE